MLEMKASVCLRIPGLVPYFLSFIKNDIVHGIKGEILIFADDTTLLASGTDPAETAMQLNRDLGKISAWAQK